MDRKTGLFTKETKTEPFVEKFETSLKRLGLERVDAVLTAYNFRQPRRRLRNGLRRKTASDRYRPHKKCTAGFSRVKGKGGSGQGYSTKEHQ